MSGRRIIPRVFSVFPVLTAVALATALAAGCSSPGGAAPTSAGTDLVRGEGPPRAAAPDWGGPAHEAAPPARARGRSEERGVR
ncbi:endoglucanase, partial [Streptomyces sp. NPDC007346]